jgi:putative cardiolipin synthase
MQIVWFLVAAGALSLVTSFIAVLSYGHFARQDRGRDESALPIEPAATTLDKGIAPRLEQHPGKSGLTLLSGNLDAFAIRALTARTAGRSLDLMYYYWLDDLTGRLLAHEIVQAADRGVRVRLLLDDINARGRDKSYLALDAHPNISVRLFNPSRARDGGLRRGIEMLLRAYSVTRRMHNKAWIADGRLAIVGGRNIGDPYFDAAETSNFRDIDMIMMGPAVQQTEKVFDDFWNSEVSMPIRVVAGGRRGALDRLRSDLAQLAESDRAQPYVERALERVSVVSMLDDASATRWTRDANVVSDPPEKALARGDGNWIMSKLMPVIASAERSVEITSPYFVPGVEGTNRLRRMVEDGIDVSVLTNSLAATDVAAVHGGYAPYRKDLIAAGVRLYELQPHAHRTKMSLFGSKSASLHTKAFTVDEGAGFVGSFNFDPRSVSLNTEMGVLFREATIVGQMRELFREETGPQMSYAVRLDADGKLLWESEEDGGLRISRREPEAGLTRRAVAAIVSWLPIESQL